MQKILLITLFLSAVSTQEFSNPDGIPGTLSLSTQIFQRTDSQSDNYGNSTYISLLGYGLGENKGESFHWLGWKMPISNSVTLSGYFNMSNNNNNGAYSMNGQDVKLSIHIPVYKMFQ